MLGGGVPNIYIHISTWLVGGIDVDSISIPLRRWGLLAWFANLVTVGIIPTYEFPEQPEITMQLNPKKHLNAEA